MQEVVGEVLLDDVALVAAADDEVHPAGTGNDLPPSPMLVIHFFNGRRADLCFGWESDNHVTGKNRESRLLPNLRFQRVAVTGATGFLGGRVVRQLKEANAKSLRSTTDVEPPRVILQIAIWKQYGSMNQRSLRRPCSRFCLIRSYTSMQQSPQHVTQAALEQTVQTNLLPSIALMMACMEMKLKRLILMGSGKRSV